MFGVDLQFARVSSLQFFLTLTVSILIIALFSLYLLIYAGYLGKPMHKYLTARFYPGRGIIQEYIHKNVYLKMASVKNSVFQDLESGHLTKITKKWYQFKDQYIYTKAKPIIAKATVTINGVITLLIWNVNPPLPEKYLLTLEQLANMGFNSITDIIEGMTDQEDGQPPKLTPETEIRTELSVISIKNFLSIHMQLKDRNSIKVTANDILEFSNTYTDDHAKKSVAEKEITIKMKRSGEDKYQKYAFLIIGFMLFAGFLLIAWKIKYGVK